MRTETLRKNYENKCPTLFLNFHLDVRPRAFFRANNPIALTIRCEIKDMPLNTGVESRVGCRKESKKEKERKRREGEKGERGEDREKDREKLCCFFRSYNPAMKSDSSVTRETAKRRNERIREEVGRSRETRTMHPPQPSEWNRIKASRRPQLLYNLV
jgi:hypothetical protein